MNKDLSKDFYRYVLPSMVSMLLSGFYSMVDGIFVGNAAGSQALAAINLVYPIQAVSYTHLDVYKRQIPGCVLRSGGAGGQFPPAATRSFH